jgi:peroxin-6
VASASPHGHAMSILPCRSFPATGFVSVDEDAAYVSPLLAFNLGFLIIVVFLAVPRAGCV